MDRTPPASTAPASLPSSPLTLHLYGHAPIRVASLSDAQAHVAAELPGVALQVEACGDGLGVYLVDEDDRALAHVWPVAA